MVKKRRKRPPKAVAIELTDRQWAGVKPVLRPLRRADRRGRPPHDTHIRRCHSRELQKGAVVSAQPVAARGRRIVAIAST